MRGKLAVGVWLACGGVAHAALEGENVGKQLTAVRTPSPPTIDGRLDDAVWAQAVPDERFVQERPSDGEPGSERTSVRVLYDDRAVYVGVRCFDREADKIVGKLVRRDQASEADWVLVSFDSRLDHRSGFGFILNAAGVQSDVSHFDDSSISFEWDAVWDGEVHRDAQGWSAELRIPLSVLRFSAAEEQVWGFNVARYISRKQEVAAWSHLGAGVDADVSHWGHLRGIRGVRPRRTFELRPYYATQLRIVDAEGAAPLGLEPGARKTADFDLGLDLKLGISRSLTLDVTLNPDFGQIEADPAVLNLSPFETYFAEKRPFFVEGADVFALPIQVYYSRRIGQPSSSLAAGDVVLDDGREVAVVDAPQATSLLGAAKLTGGVGDRFTVGALAALTDSETIEVGNPVSGFREVERAPLRSFVAARGRLALRGTSSLGFLATAVNRVGGRVTEPGADHDAFVQSLDARVAPDTYWRGDAQIVLSERVGGPSGRDELGGACVDGLPGCLPLVRADGTPQRPGDVGAGGFLAVQHAGPRWLSRLQLETLSPHLDINDLGFEQASNKHIAVLDVERRWQKPSGVFRYKALGGDFRWEGNYDGVPGVATVGVESDVVWQDHSWTFLRVAANLPGAYNPYETGDGGLLERLPWILGFATHGTDSRRLLVAEVSLEGGHAVDDTGWWTYGSARLDLNVLPQLVLQVGGSASWEANDLRMAFSDGCVDEDGEPCTIRSDTRRYRLAQLDAGSLSFTLRGSWTFSPRASLSAYSQLYTARGEFHDRRVVVTEGRHPKIRREDLTVDPSGEEGQDGIEETALQINVVFRWEVAPGSTVMAVYTRGQEAPWRSRGGKTEFDVGRFQGGPSEEVVLLKFVYFYL